MADIAQKRANCGVHVRLTIEIWPTVQKPRDTFLQGRESGAGWVLDCSPVVFDREAQARRIGGL